MNLPIAVFDSGVGGVSVLHALYKVLPEESYLYYADVKNAPYGAKSTAETSLCVAEAVRFLDHLSVKALVIACNTATSAAVDAVRNDYSFPVIGMEPAIKPALEENRGKRILTLATEKTLQEKKFQQLKSLIDPNGLVTTVAMNGLVNFAEHFDFDSEQVVRYIRRQLSDLDLSTFSAVVLGCTHFAFYRKIIASQFPIPVRFYDGVEGTVAQLTRCILPSTNEKVPTRLFLSGLEADAEFLQPYLDHLEGRTFSALGQDPS